MITSQAVIADLVPPRQRARYMAPIGAVFGLSSVVGPLLGGWFTDGIGWRWCFWINLPVGAVALTVGAFALRLPRRAVEVTFDYVGFALMATAVTCTVLVTTWCGTLYAWSDPVILGMAVGGLLTWVLFFLSQRRAKEPIIPLWLFRSRIFNTATLIGLLVVGIGMFAIIGYLPTYLQMVYSLSATESGLLLIPMVVGMMATALPSGRVMSSTGRYKIFPIVGAVLVCVAALLMSTLDTETSLVLVCVYVFLLGAALGGTMQPLVLAVQNDFPASDVGTATSANNFFREIGSTLGTAAVGSVFAHRLADQPADRRVPPLLAVHALGDADRAVLEALDQDGGTDFRRGGAEVLEFAEGLISGGAVGEAEGDGVLVHGHELSPWVGRHPPPTAGGAWVGEASPICETVCIEEKL
jgi:predicted MFS family arabinose efflux permease